MTKPTQAASSPPHPLAHLLRVALRPVVRVFRWLLPHVHGLYRAFGLFLLVALALGLACVWLFGELAEGVMAGSTKSFDEGVLRWMNQHSSPGLDRITLQITSIGNGATVVVIALLLGAFLWAMRYRLAVALLFVSLVGANLIHVVLKLTFDRPRPELFVLQTPFARPMSASFPSGHATAAMVLYLVVGYLLGRLGGKGWFRFWANFGAGVLILAIGASRMYLGVHYPSDVIAGYLMGFGWVTICIFGIEAVQVVRGRSRLRDLNLPGRLGQP
ncbi:MAG: phosphatase PAP2 family protein [Gemmatimonadales bacterium]